MSSRSKKKKGGTKTKKKVKEEPTYDSEDSDVDAAIGRTRMNEKAMEPRRLPLHGNYKSLEDSDEEEVVEDLVPPFLPADASEEDHRPTSTIATATRP